MNQGGPHSKTAYYKAMLRKYLMLAILFAFILLLFKLVSPPSVAESSVELYRPQIVGGLFFIIIAQLSLFFFLRKTSPILLSEIRGLEEKVQADKH